MSDITNFFEGRAIRMHIDTEGNPWFAAPDVCDALGIVNSRDAIKDLDKDETRVVSTDTNAGKRDINFLSESGMYTLTLGSRKEESKRFRKWVTAEVLPKIRQTGHYIAPTSVFAGLEEFTDDPMMVAARAQTKMTLEYLKVRKKQEDQDREMLRQAVALLEAKAEAKEAKEQIKELAIKLDDTEITSEYKIRRLRQQKYGPGYGHIPKGTLQLDNIRKRYFFGVSEHIISAYLQSVLHPMENFEYTDEHGGKHATICFMEDGLAIRYKGLIKGSIFIKETPKQFKFSHPAIVAVDQKTFAIIKTDLEYLSESDRTYVFKLLSEKIKESSPSDQ